jgi:hypothetical protein
MKLKKLSDEEKMELRDLLYYRKETEAMALEVQERNKHYVTELGKLFGVPNAHEIKWDDLVECLL